MRFIDYEDEFLQEEETREETSAKATFVTLIAAAIAHIMLAIIIPIFVLKLNYSFGMIFSSLICMIPSLYILAIVCQILYPFLQKHFVSTFKRIVIIISLIGVILFSSRYFSISNVAPMFFPDKHEVEQLYEIAEEVTGKEELFELCDKVTWDKEKGTYEGSFNSSTVLLKITYDENFEIVDDELLDYIVPGFLVIHILFVIIAIITRVLSTIIFGVSKIVVKIFNKIPKK